MLHKHQPEQFNFMIERRDLTNYLINQWKNQIGFREVANYVAIQMRLGGDNNPLWAQYCQNYDKYHRENEVQQLILTTFSSLNN